MTGTTRCEHCGSSLTVGEWPFCPHGRSQYGAHAIQSDEAFIGGQVIENLGHDPITVYSRTELKQAMATHGAEQRIKYVPGDHYLKDWSKCIDPQTLENARILLSRPQTSSRPARDDRATLKTFSAEWRKPV